MSYALKVRFLKQRYAVALARRWRRRRGIDPQTAEAYMQKYAAGRSVADIGCMWGIDGEHSFAALRAGAKSVKSVDLYRTEEFDRKLAAADGNIEYVFGDASSDATAEAVGVVDLVWCFGLFYHHQSPYEILATLRKMCGERLILETAGIPEVPGSPNMAMWVPYLPENGQKLWRADSDGKKAERLGVTAPFDPARGYANNFVLPTPSMMTAMLRTAGFELESWHHWPAGPFRYVFVAKPVDGLAFQPG